MRQKPGTLNSHGEKIVKDIRRATRKQYSAEKKTRIVLAPESASGIWIDVHSSSLQK